MSSARNLGASGSKSQPAVLGRLRPRPNRLGEQGEPYRSIIECVHGVGSGAGVGWAFRAASGGRNAKETAPDRCPGLHLTAQQACSGLGPAGGAKLQQLGFLWVKH